MAFERLFQRFIKGAFVVFNSGHQITRFSVQKLNVRHRPGLAFFRYPHCRPNPVGGKLLFELTVFSDFIGREPTLYC